MGKLTVSDPALMIYVMHDASHALRGALMWLIEHAESEVDKETLFQEYVQVREERSRVDAWDVEAQAEATQRFLDRRRELEDRIDIDDHDSDACVHCRRWRGEAVD